MCQQALQSLGLLVDYFCSGARPIVKQLQKLYDSYPLPVEGVRIDTGIAVALVDELFGLGVVAPQSNAVLLNEHSHIYIGPPAQHVFHHAYYRVHILLRLLHHSAARLRQLEQGLQYQG